MAKKIIISLLMASVIMGCASKSIQPTEHAVWTEAAAMNTAKRWADATSKPDVIELEKILTEDYVHIHATALVENRQQFIDALKAGTRKYDPIILEDAKVRIHGATAIVTARFNLKEISGGRTIEGVNRITLVLVYTTSSHVASFQATPIPAAAGQ
jgi:ketosteroid isomerase-like protein